MLERKQLLIVGVIGLIAILFFVLVIISAFLPKQEISSTEQPTPTASELIIPTSSQNSTYNSSSEQQTSENVQLLTVSPPDGSLDQAPVVQVEMAFTHSMKERAFYYRVNPQVPTVISVNGDKITITPKHVWSIGKNAITVYAATESINGKKLSTPFTYSFTVKDLPFPDEEFEE